MRGSTTMPASADAVLKATEDYNARTIWDELFISGKIVHKIDDDHQIIHFSFKVCFFSLFFKFKFYSFIISIFCLFFYL